jgi:Activator of Hsp90 ATPase homolog 1-like protein
MIEPLRIELELDCAPAHAFHTWTDRLSTWWPRGHSVSGDPVAVVLEPRVGGRIFERTSSGQEIDWGWVTTWDPPQRIGYRWHMRREPAEATDVDVRFNSTPDGRTRLEIVHSGWERLGAEAEAWRDANRGGWDGLLPHFTAACDRAMEGDST